jgi:hypothetical protein
LEFEIDIAQYIRMIVFCAFKTSSSRVKDGSLKRSSCETGVNTERTYRGEDKEEKIKENIDPRWDKLKQLLTDK